MQHLINSKWSPFRNANNAAAYSPFQEFIQDIDNKRSRLFPDRRRIPGRKTKFIIAIAYLIHIYAVMKVVQARKIYSLKEEQQRMLQRKVVPYFQSISDFEYTTLKHRTDLILCQIFKSKGGEKFLQKQQRYHNRNITWVPHTIGVWTGSGTGRYVGSITYNQTARYLSGFDIQNI